MALTEADILSRIKYIRALFAHLLWDVLRYGDDDITKALIATAPSFDFNWFNDSHMRAAFEWLRDNAV